MIRVLSGNLFESKAQTWVNTVNCVGVMGKGVALGFKQRFPEMFADYQRRCERGEVRLGRPYLFKHLVGPWIVNFPTKQHWRQVTNLQDIISGLEYLRAHYKDWGIKSLAVPPLGCGNGQLEWRVVGPTLSDICRSSTYLSSCTPRTARLILNFSHHSLERWVEKATSPRARQSRNLFSQVLSPSLKRSDDSRSSHTIRQLVEQLFKRSLMFLPILESTQV